jgi:hypothetical protein
MKNPMDRQLEKRLSDRAVAIGREAEVPAFAELLEGLRSSSANVRRLSASALGKLAWLGVDQAAAVPALAPVARADPHAQTRQYAIKALKAYGAAAQPCVHDLRDLSRNPDETDYNRRDAASAADFVEEAVRVCAAQAEHRCQRYSVRVSADEFARSQQAFQRVYCDHCFDYIEYGGLDTPQYKMSMYKKQMLYQQEGKRLVSVYPRDLPSLDVLLTSKLRLFGYTVSANERSEVSFVRRPPL